MTRAFDDIEAVNRLLEEKEKDLELTVQIGKELLTQNNALENKILDLEVDLKTLNEERSQLLHELHKKAQLIAILTNDVDDNCENDTTVQKISTLDLLQKKVLTLQNENKLLKLEASELACQTDAVEDQERKLMEDIATQLNITNGQYKSLNLELERQREENRLQYEQIVSLAAQLTEEELRLHRLTEENEENMKLLHFAKANQDFLVLELSELKTRYQEVLRLLQETQYQLRAQRKKVPACNSFASQKDSLHCELMDSSLLSEQSVDSGISGEKNCIVSNCLTAFAATVNKTAFEKTFETLQCLPLKSSSRFYSIMESNKASSKHILASKASLVPITHNLMREKSQNDYLTTTWQSKMNSPHKNLVSVMDDDYPSQPSGVPGAPGARDLEAALKRLTPADVIEKRAELIKISAETFPSAENSTSMPIEIGTPDSALSFDFSNIGIPCVPFSNHWLCPQKLQIVKPIEGSQTLNHWSKLATPTLSGLLEERPGVTIRGGRGLDELGLHIYSLSDVEEDFEDLPRKQFEAAACVYTFTNSTVLHPDDELANNLSYLPLSHLPSLVASASTSRQTSGLSTPISNESRRNSCSTFSVHVGLAAMLNERRANSISKVNATTRNGTPILTPCNIFESFPSKLTSSSSNSPFIESTLSTKKTKCSNLIPRRQQVFLTNLEKRALRSLKLVEKVESLGLENIITTQKSSADRIDKQSGDLRSSLIGTELCFGIDKSGKKRKKGEFIFESDKLLSCKTDADKTPFFSKNSNSVLTRFRYKQTLRQKIRCHSYYSSSKCLRPDLGTVDVCEDSLFALEDGTGKLEYDGASNNIGTITPSPNITQSFVGSLNSLLFGRKGGWL